MSFNPLGALVGIGGNADFPGLGTAADNLFGLNNSKSTSGTSGTSGNAAQSSQYGNPSKEIQRLAMQVGRLVAELQTMEQNQNSATPATNSTSLS